MKQLLSIFVLVLTRTFVHAQTQPQTPCAGHAQYGALRSYHATYGTIQGSEGPEAVARLKESRGDEHLYVVTVYDNNEDGDKWHVNYIVRVRGAQNQCQVTFVKDLSRSSN